MPALKRSSRIATRALSSTRVNAKAKEKAKTVPLPPPPPPPLLPTTKTKKPPVEVASPPAVPLTRTSSRTRNKKIENEQKAEEKEPCEGGRDKSEEDGDTNPKRGRGVSNKRDNANTSANQKNNNSNDIKNAEDTKINQKIEEKGSLKRKREKSEEINNTNTNPKRGRSTRISCKQSSANHNKNIDKDSDKNVKVDEESNDDSKNVKKEEEKTEMAKEKIVGTGAVKPKNKATECLQEEAVAASSTPTVTISPVATRSKIQPLRQEAETSPSGISGGVYNANSLSGRVVRVNPNLLKVKIENDYRPIIRGEDSMESAPESQGSKYNKIDIEPYNPYVSLALSPSKIKVEPRTKDDESHLNSSGDTCDKNIYLSHNAIEFLTSLESTSTCKPHLYISEEGRHILGLLKNSNLQIRNDEVENEKVDFLGLEKDCESDVGAADDELALSKDLISNNHAFNINSIYPTPPPTDTSGSGGESPEHPFIQSSSSSSSSLSSSSVSSMSSDDTNVVTVLTKIPASKELYRIHGAATVNGNLTLLVEWELPDDSDDDEDGEVEVDREELIDCNLVDAKEMNKKYPQEVIRFYEKHICFCPTRQNNNEDNERDQLRIEMHDLTPSPVNLN